MVEDLWLIGIGTGSPKHVTLEGLEAIREASVILVPNKGSGKEDLAELRHQIIHHAGFAGEILNVDYPVRDAELPYLERVERWHDQIAQCWQQSLERAKSTGPVALLVWGDPSLYDSTIRIANRLKPRPRLRVIPGITAIQALTAAHGIPLNSLAGAVHITTGRRLRECGWPDGTDTIVVMLDGEASFAGVDDSGIYIWWGAYLGSADEITLKGDLAEIGPEIMRVRREARSARGWLMDTYLMKKLAVSENSGGSSSETQ